MRSGVEQPVRPRIAVRTVSPESLPEAKASRSNRQRHVNRMACRALNVVVAIIGLGITLPILVLIAAVVALSSRGPIIFTQTRVGIDRRQPDSGGNGRRRRNYGGRLFRMYKFRTMRADASADLQVWAHPQDPRVTSVGRFLRQYRLDELPQLINVLKGEMNVVGPRPEQPIIFASLNETITGYALRQSVLPGITGLAQINQSYDRCVDDVRRKLDYDLEYIERQTPMNDLQILVRTLPVIITRRGAW